MPLITTLTHSANYMQAAKENKSDLSPVQSRQPSNNQSSSSSSSQQQPSRADTPDHSEEGDGDSKVDGLSMTGFNNNHNHNNDKYGSDDDVQFRRVDSLNTPLSVNTNAAIGSLTPTTVSRDNGSNNSISQEAMDTQMLDNEGIDNCMTTYGASGAEEEEEEEGEEENEEEDDKRIEETLISSSSSSSLDDHNPLFVGCRHVDYFEKVKMVDEGAYGVVFSARNRKTGELVALKKVKISKV
jgi:hypothetical protein